MENNDFINGLFFNKPHDNAPNFVKGSLGINVDQFVNWLSENQIDGKVRIDLLESKGGKFYAKKNDWQPNQQQPSPQDVQKYAQGQHPQYQAPVNTPPVHTENITDINDPEDCPF